jgi:hypothetical protein
MSEEPWVFDDNLITLNFGEEGCEVRLHECSRPSIIKLGRESKYKDHIFSDREDSQPIIPPTQRNSSAQAAKQQSLKVKAD